MLLGPLTPVRWLIATPDLGGDPDVFPLLAGQQFPQRSPLFATTAMTSKSGRYFATASYSAPLWKWKVTYDFLRHMPTRDELFQLWGFFNARGGQAGSFSYFDPTDNLATAQNFGIGDGVTTSFQLQRAIGRAVEPVYVLNGTPTIFLNGAATTAYTPGDFGEIEFDAPPASGAVLSWSGSFMFLCHFTQDDLGAMRWMDLLWSNDGLEFQSFKP